MKEQYQPSQEEINKAEEMMTPEEKKLSDLYENIQKISPEIDAAVSSLEEELSKYDPGDDFPYRVFDPGKKLVAELQGKHPIEKIAVLSDFLQSVEYQYGGQYENKLREKIEKKIEEDEKKFGRKLSQVELNLRRLELINAKPGSGMKWLINEVKSTIIKLEEPLKKLKISE